MIFWMSVTAIGSMPANGSSSRMNLRRHHQRAGDLRAPALAARQRVGRRAGQRREAELGEQLARALTALDAVSGIVSRIARMFCSTVRPAEDRRLLRQVADALARADVHRIVGDVLAVERHAPRVGRREADRHVERGRLARAVRSEQADHLARGDVQAHTAHHGAPAVRLGQFVRLERRHSLRG